jgi:glycosyltransferase involved in cell wall biosynthesis
MLHVLHVLYEPIRSGQTTHVLSLVRGANRGELSATVVVPWFLRSTADDLKQAGAAVVPLRFGRLYWSAGAITALARLTRASSFQVVHVHSQEAGLVARPVARASGAKAVVYTPQTIDIRRERLRWLYVVLERALARVTDTIIASCQSDRLRLIGWGIPANKVVSIPNGVDTSRGNRTIDSTAVRRRLGLPDTGPLVVQAGRLSVQKDPFMFLKGAEAVLEHCPTAKFVWVGEGPLRAGVDREIQNRRLQGSVILAGYLSEVSDVMSCANIVTLSSRWEGMPYALLEAMAQARPVVATRVNGCGELVDEGVSGYLVPAGDWVGWSQRVIHLIEHPDLAAVVGGRGQKRVREQYSLEGMITSVRRVYAELTQ